MSVTRVVWHAPAWLGAEWCEVDRRADGTMIGNDP